MSIIVLVMLSFAQLSWLIELSPWVEHLSWVFLFIFNLLKLKGTRLTQAIGESTRRYFISVTNISLVSIYHLVSELHMAACSMFLFDFILSKFWRVARLYVGSLHFNLTESDIKQVFEPFGELEFVDLHRDPMTGRSKGYAFVQWVRTHVSFETILILFAGIKGQKTPRWLLSKWKALSWRGVL